MADIPDPRDPRAPFGGDDYEIIESKLLYEGYGRLKRLLFRHKRYDGTWSAAISRELFESGDAVVLLPYDPGRDELVLVEQIRAAPMGAQSYPWLLECVAGRIALGEAPEDVGRRETEEEAGLTLGRLESIGGFFASPGIFAEYLHFFCAEADTGTAGGIHGLDTEQEDIRVVVLGFAAAMDLLAHRKILSGPTAICLQWLALNRERLRRNWGA